MRTLVLAACALAGCGVANYTYNFDLTDPGARNLTKPGERDAIEDADVKTEVLVDPTSFKAIALDVTNKTDVPVDVQWNAIAVVMPDHTQMPLHADAQLASVDPTAKVSARLIPFELPSQGAPAKAYDGATFELVVPMVVRGQPREYRYHLIARVTKL
jgi:hypothetical protein